MANYLRFKGQTGYAMAAVETPEPARTSETFNVTSLSAGVQSGTSLFAGFTNPNGIVVNNDYGKLMHPPGGGFNSVNNGLVAQSTYECYDSEISIRRLAENIVYLRVNSGQAIFLRDNDGKATVGLISEGLNLASNARSGTEIVRDTNDLAHVAYNGSTITKANTWTLGAKGFEVYVKCDGVEVKRFTEHRLPNKGYAAAWCGQYSDGIGDLTLNYVPHTFIGSNRPLRVLDIRDFGAKEVSTTGTMSAASPTLTVADATDFEIGGSIIVESNQHVRGTEGPGGAWPPVSYVNAAAREADTTKATGTYAWDRDTGIVRYWKNLDGVTGWVDPATLPSNISYHTSAAIPYALRATITNKVGNVLTLDTNSVAATTDANVYVDCVPAFFPFTDTGGSVGGAAFNFRLEDMKLQIPEGSFPLGTAMLSDKNRHGMELYGAGKASTELWSPLGTQSVGLYSNNANNVKIHDFKMRGNFYLGANGHFNGSHFSIDQNGNYEGWPTTCGLGNSTSVLPENIYDMEFHNVMAQAIVIVSSINCTAARCTLTNDDGARTYTQWYMGGVDSSNASLIDCTINCRQFIKGFEWFNCSGGTFLRCGGRNVFLSTNSSNSWLIDEWDSYMEGGAYQNDYLSSGYIREGIIYAAANAYHSTVSGTIRNPRIRQLGYADAVNNDTLLAAIHISADCNGVIVEGEYTSATLPFSDDLGGYLMGPDYARFTDAQFSGPMGVLDQGQNTVITGIRQVGVMRSGQPEWAGITIDSPTYDSATVTNNIASSYAFKAGTTKSGNRLTDGTAVP